VDREIVIYLLGVFIKSSSTPYNSVRNPPKKKTKKRKAKKKKKKRKERKRRTENRSLTTSSNSLPSVAATSLARLKALARQLAPPSPTLFRGVADFSE
jgi:hypothetical protein